MIQKKVEVSQAGRPSGLRRQGQEIPQSRNLVHECVLGSNPIPVTKRFEHNKAEPSADKFYHTATSIHDDSAKQKKTKKNRNIVCGW